MIKFKFMCNVNYENQPETTVTHETDAMIVSDILEEFANFLRGCGYSVDSIVEEEVE